MIASAELRSLVEAVCNGTATTEQFERLNVLLAADEEAALFYATYVRMHGLLLWRYRDEIIVPESRPFPAPAPSEILPPAYWAYPGWQATEEAGLPLGRFALLVSVLLVLVGLTVAFPWGRWKAATPVAAHGELPGVGYITGMTSCQWTQGTPRAGFYDRVTIGQTFQLDAGLLEITYDTGFKAILQGPVTYEITSDNGGYLSVGKLTGKATTDRARGFVVDMPSASVTDLGTEFGAEVAANGQVETVVFSGEVKLVTTTPRGDVGKGQVLRTGQAAQVHQPPTTDRAHPDRLRLPTVEVVAIADRSRFTRAMPPIPEQMLIGADAGNGSFEEPAVGPDNCDAEASDPAAGVFAKIQDAVPQGWNRTCSLRTKGTAVQGVTGEQYVVLQRNSTSLSTRLDGKRGHLPVQKYAPHTVYVLTADLGGNVRGMKGRVALGAGSEPISYTVSVSVAKRDVLEPILMLALNTDDHPEFVGKPIGVSFVKTESSPMSQFYIDNVVLRAFPSEPWTVGKTK